LLILLSIFGGAVVVQLIYHIIFISAFKRKAVEAPLAAPEPVSVIVCAHDEEQNLRDLLPALLTQNYHQFEVIIVNDRSNDNTYDFLLEQTKLDSRVKMVNVKDTPAHVNSKKFALTLGIRAAAHDLILLTDADCRPSSDQWITSMASKASSKQFVLGFSPYQEKPGFLNAFIRFESLVTALQYMSFALLKNPYMGVGRNLAYRKSLFLEKKGFNNFLHVMGGDDDLFVNQHANGANTTVQLNSSSLVLSVPEKTLSGFFYQKIRHLSVGKRYKTGHKVLLGLFTFTWMLTWFVGLPLIFLYEYYYFIIIALFLRCAMLTWAVQSVTKRTGVKFNLWLVPVLDFVYPIYYISTGLVAMFTRKVRWKT
jgi:glycosyltransferase involved in cell wall biosynthesis